MIHDWIDKLQPLLNAGWEVEDGKLQPSKIQIATDLNWIFQNVDFDCTLWNKLYHEIVTNKTKIHSHCHDCIKIVAKPKTLHDLAIIEMIQETMLYPCKCGIDTRPNTQVIYGAFWYNRGFTEARARYRKIKERFIEEGIEHVPLIIKKGCTEFENRLGDSTKWKRPTAEQLQEEKDLESVIRYTPMPPNNIPELIKHHTHHLWVKWAYQNGDNTYLEFTNGIPLYEPLVTFSPEEPVVKKPTKKKVPARKKKAKNG
jgi:hypothetical protein